MDQRDLSEQSYRLLSAGLDMPKPDKLVLPSIYIANMLYQTDVRLTQSGEPYTCRNWRPATELSSPLDVFPLFSIMRASNPEQFQELPVLTSHMYEDSPHSPQRPQRADIDAQAGPSASKASAQPTAPKQSDSGSKRKSRRRPSKPAKSCKTSSEVANTSPVDNVEPPDIVITLGDSEYEEFNLSSGSDTSSSSGDILSSPEYAPSNRLLATSDCSTVPISNLMSPESSEIKLLTPEHVSDYRLNPLSETGWSDSE